MEKSSLQGRIVRYNTYTSIQPFVDYTSETSMHPLLRNLSVWEEVIHQYVFPMYEYIEDTKELRIPAGLRESYLGKWLSNNPKNPVDYTYYDGKTVPVFNPPRATMFYEPRSNIQVKALEFLNNFKLPQRFLSLDTGDGKTFCVVSYCVRSGQVPAVFVSSLRLLEQWKEKILEYTDIPEEEILTVADGGIDKIDFGKPYQFLLFSHRTVGDYISKKDGNLEDLLRRLNYTIKVFDEAHQDMESIARIDRHTFAPSLYVTATPMRTNRYEDELYQRMYKTVPKFRSTDQNIVEKSEKYHTVVICKFNSSPSMDFQIAFQKASRLRGFNVPTYSKYILEEKFTDYAEKVFKILYQVVLSQGKVNRKTVILVKTIDLLDSLKEFIDEELTSRGLYLTTTRFHSKVPKGEKEQALDGDIIFSTDSSLSTAIDIPGLEAVISLIPTSSETLTRQMLGRLREIPGREVYYFDLVDSGFKECTRQLYNRKKNVYTRKAKTIKEVKL